LAYVKLKGKAKLENDLAQQKIRVTQAQAALNRTVNGVPLTPGSQAYIDADKKFTDAIEARDAIQDALTNYVEPAKPVKKKSAKQIEAERQEALINGPADVVETAGATGATGDTNAVVKSANVSVEDFIRNLDVAGAETINQIKADLGLKNLDGKLDIKLVDAISLKEADLQRLIDATGRDIDRLTYYKTSKSAGGTGAAATIFLSDPTEAASYVRSVFKTTLQRDPTSDEIAKYSDILIKAEKKSPKKTVNGVSSGGLGSPIEFLTQEVQKLPEFSTKKKQKDTLTTQSLQSVARANGMTLSSQEIEQYNLDIRNGKDIEVIKNQIRNVAGLGRPDNIKKLLAEGTDLGTIYAPYKRTMANLLEIDPESIDLNDTTLQTAIGDRELPIYEFRKILKKDPRWQYTNNAREEVSNKVLRVLQDFGFQG
jgi:hypothetical protein